jgi:hypothetical protein
MTNPFWNDPPTPRDPFRIVDDLQRDEDEKPDAKLRARLIRVEVGRRVTELVGPHMTKATAMIDGEMLRGEDGRSLRFTIWAPLKRIAVEGLPRGIRADDPAIIRRAQLLKAKGVTYLPFEHGERVSPSSLSARLGLGDLPTASPAPVDPSSS